MTQERPQAGTTPTTQSKRYGLPTALGMIVGICVGSGIYFKSDNVLVATGGNVGLGVLVFVLAALSIVFGSLSFATLASHTDSPGGLAAYAEFCFGRRMATVAGWFMAFVYLPSIATVVAWVAGIYACTLFGWPNELWCQMLAGMSFLAASLAWNAFLPRLSGWFQNCATVAKLLPLVVVMVCGFFLGDPASVLSSAGTTIVSDATGSVGWMGAVAPVAFALDGWICAATIAPELKDAKRSLPIALAIAPLIIVAVYIGYFVGVSTLMGPERVMALGDGHLSALFAQLYGERFATIPTAFVLVAVMGTSNGLVLAAVRTPYALALRDEVPGARRLSVLNTTFGMPLASAGLEVLVCIFWAIVHTLVQSMGLLPNSDVSEISVVALYVLFIPFYLHVIKMWRAGQVKGAFMGVVAPILACAGSVFILLGAMQSSTFWLFLGISAAVWVISWCYARATEQAS